MDGSLFSRFSLSFFSPLEHWRGLQKQGSWTSISSFGASTEKFSSGTRLSAFRASSLTFLLKEMKTWDRGMMGRLLWEHWGSRHRGIPWGTLGKQTQEYPLSARVRDHPGQYSETSHVQTFVWDVSYPDLIITYCVPVFYCYHIL